MEQEIRQIIEVGTKAPSGDNCQPWKFRLTNNELCIFNIPERDDSLYSFGQYSSFIAHGALLENISIAAETFGYLAQVSLFPDTASQKNLVARVIFEKSTPHKHALFDATSVRTTNRKPYSKEPLQEGARTSLLVPDTEGLRFLLIEDRGKIERLAKAASTNERILFENRFLHAFFFEHISWTKEQDDKKSIGFYIKTLELPPPARLIFKAIRHWSIVKPLNALGFSKMIAYINSQIYSSSSAFGILTIDEETPQNFVSAGRLLERLWLTATKEGLSVQPLMGVLLLMNQIRKNASGALSPRHRTLVQNAYREILSVSEAGPRIPVIMFRLGKGDKPSAQASRLRPDIAA